jgi:hypothetical protein
VAVDPRNLNTLYVAGSTGVFRSTDGVASWTRASHEVSVRSLAIDPLDSGRVYALNDRGILKEHGRRRELERGLSPRDGERCVPWLVEWVVVALGEGGPSTVYAGGNPRGVFKSLDGGSTWTLATSGLIATSIDSLAIDPQSAHRLRRG